MLFWTPHFVLDSTFRLDSTLKIGPAFYPTCVVSKVYAQWRYGFVPITFTVRQLTMFVIVLFTEMLQDCVPAYKNCFLIGQSQKHLLAELAALLEEFFVICTADRK